VKVPDEQEVTSHQRRQSFRAGSRAAATEERAAADPLAWQSSILSLTLEELQNSL
jgi:ABA responsive element binding factor